MGKSHWRIGLSKDEFLKNYLLGNGINKNNIIRKSIKYIRRDQNNIKFY